MKRYLVVILSYGSIEDSTDYDSLELAEACCDGIGLVDNECIYSRIYDRHEDVLVDEGSLEDLDEEFDDAYSKQNRCKALKDLELIRKEIIK